MEVPVAVVIASASAIATAAAPKSPHDAQKMPQSARSIGNRASAPAPRASLRLRALMACQLSSSQTRLGGLVVSQPQRKFSWAGDTWPANMADVLLSSGAAAASPAVTT